MTRFWRPQEAYIYRERDVKAQPGGIAGLTALVVSPSLSHVVPKLRHAPGRISTEVS